MPCRFFFAAPLPLPPYKPVGALGCGGSLARNNLKTLAPLAAQSELLDRSRAVLRSGRILCNCTVWVTINALGVVQLPWCFFRILLILALFRLLFEVSCTLRELCFICRIIGFCLA